MKPIITIDGFEQGMLQDPTIPARNGFKFSAGLDIHCELGILQVAQKLKAMTQAASPNAVTATILWMVKYKKKNKVYGIDNGGSGRIYDYNNTQAGKWALAHDDTNAGVGQGLKEFNDNLFWASNTKLGKYDGVTTWTDTFKTFKEGDTAWHPMVIFMGKLMIGDGRYIATLEEDDTWDDDALILPPGYRVRSLVVYGDRLIIGTWRGSSIYEQPEAVLYSWDGIVGHEEENYWRLQECGIHALYPWRNILIVFAGISGNVYGFDGVTVNKIPQIPGLELERGGWTEVLPGAICEYQGNLLFGIKATTISGANVSGIYCLGQKTDNQPIALTYSHIISTGEMSNLQIGALFSGATNSFFASYYDGAAGSYGVDEIDTDRRNPSEAYMESQTYDIPRDSQARLLRGVELIARPLQSLNTVAIKYKLDNASPWSTLGTIIATNQHRPFKGIRARAKTIGLRLEFTTSTLNNYSPEISAIKVY